MVSCVIVLELVGTDLERSVVAVLKVGKSTRAVRSRESEGIIVSVLGGLWWEDELGIVVDVDFWRWRR